MRTPFSVIGRGANPGVRPPLRAPVSGLRAACAALWLAAASTGAAAAPQSLDDLLGNIVR